MNEPQLNPVPAGPPLFAWPVFSAAGAAQLGDGVCVVVDQLRASSSMATALANGAAAVHVCGEVDEALAKASALRQQGLKVKLGGERGGLAIEGFDFGNLPREYGRDEVEGVHIVFTTTNGTRAINHAIECGAGEVLIGCLFNRQAVAGLAMKLACAAPGRVRAIHLLCAGTRGTVTLDDCLAAGAIAQACAELGADVHGGAALPYGDDTAVLYAELWTLACKAGAGAGGGTGEVEAMLHRSRGGRNLERIGMKTEIAAVAAVDTLQTVPRLRGGVLVAEDGLGASAK